MKVAGQFRFLECGEIAGKYGTGGMKRIEHMRILRKKVMVSVILLGLLLSACGGNNGQLADESDSTGQSTHVENIDQKEKEMPASDSWFSHMVVYDSGYSGASDGEEPVTDEYHAGLEAEECRESYHTEET